MRGGRTTWGCHIDDFINVVTGGDGEDEEVELSKKRSRGASLKDPRLCIKTTSFISLIVPDKEAPPRSPMISPPLESSFCGLSWCGKSWHRWWEGVPGGDGPGHERGWYRWMCFKVRIRKKLSLDYLITFNWLVVEKPEALEWEA